MEFRQSPGREVFFDNMLPAVPRPSHHGDLFNAHQAINTD